MATPSTQFHSRQPSTTVHTPGAPILPTTESSTPSLPPPETFDFLPPLHSLLARILLPSGASLPSTNAETTAETTAETASGTGHLDIKDLGTAVSQIKVRIQRARAAVGRMGDVERGVEEQEEEIEELEARIERMRGVLRGLGGGQEGDRMEED